MRQVTSVMLAGVAALALAGCDVLPGPGPQARGSAALSETEQVAQASFSVGDYEEAARLYERAAERDPKSVAALLGLGRSYMALRQPNRAANALGKAQQLDKSNPEVLNELGNLALSRLHPRDAIAYYDQVLARRRTDLDALTGKAVALDFLSQHLEAQGLYRTALASYPTNFALLNNYALSQALSGNIGTAIALMEELLRDPERGATVRSNMAIAYALDNRPQDARAMLEGVMGAAEIDRTLAFYADLRRQQAEGKPIGYLIFS